jgi:hypothetical protein
MIVSHVASGTTRREWLGLHVLFWHGLITTASLLAMNICYTVLHFINGLPIGEMQLPSAPIRVIIAAGIFSLLWLWIRMLIDFFRLRPSRHPVLWGWGVTIGMYIGAMFYFWFVWRPRSKMELRATDA